MQLQTSKTEQLRDGYSHATWLASRVKHRSYADDVLTRIDALRARFDVAQYGQVEYQEETYPLFAVRSRNWNDALPVVLVTGGVHGYETSGVQGALVFLEQKAESFAGTVKSGVFSARKWQFNKR